MSAKAKSIFISCIAVALFVAQPAVSGQMTGFVPEEAGASGETLDAPSSAKGEVLRGSRNFNGDANGLTLNPSVRTTIVTTKLRCPADGCRIEGIMSLEFMADSDPNYFGVCLVVDGKVFRGCPIADTRAGSNIVIMPTATGAISRLGKGKHTVEMQGVTSAGATAHRYNATFHVYTK